MDTLEIIDFRESLSTDVLETLRSKLRKKSNSDGFWFITEEEPEECYELLLKEEFIFQTYIVSDNEYRVFVGSGYS